MNDIATLKKALLMIQKLKKRIHDSENMQFEPIAIIGMSCRLPQAPDPKIFWSMLCEGKNVITSIPSERWALLKNTDELSNYDPNLNYRAGYLNDIESFDAYFFGISPREAIRMDPQQRILLEVTYESLEDAGLTLESIAGSNMGVFSSLYASPLSHLQSIHSEIDALLIPTGSAVSIAANRLSYLFDLHGPSITLDTACSSSLIAIHLACLNLQAKLCDTAVVNAVNINLLPSVHAALAKATMLSPTGQCHTFDAKADGYVQGEGCGSIILKPLKHAFRDNDRIHAIIAGSAVNQDGKTNGLTAPNGLQQEHLLRSAYLRANINPNDVSYIECHGTGTFLGDPIEIQALGEVIGKNRDDNAPCWIGSVKTNIGHLEPAAGIISIMKTALVLKNSIIPPHLNFSTPNPHIPFDNYRFNIPKTLEKLPRYNHEAIAGVSGFGFGGANAHIILKEYRPEALPSDSAKTSREQEIFTLSAKDENALNQLIERWYNYLTINTKLDLAQLCYNLHLRRTHYSHRLAILTNSIEDLFQQLIKLRNSAWQKKTVPIQKSIPQTINNFDSMDLATLAQHYIKNDLIDWIKYEENRSYPHMDLPFYPWQHKPYWPELGLKNHSAKLFTANEPNVYPLRGKHIASPLKTQQFEFIFDTHNLPEIDDTFGVLHAGYYLEMLGFAMHQLHKTTCFRLEHLHFLSPLFVSDGKTVYVQLLIKNSASSAPNVSFYSHDNNQQWIEHASASISITDAEPPHLNTHKDIIKRCPDNGTEQSFYNRITSMGMPAGDTIRWTHQYWLGTNEIWCKFRNSRPSDRPSTFVMNMHPGVLDACIQTIFLLIPQDINKPYIASQMGKIEFYDVADDCMSIYSKLKTFDPNTGAIQGEWYLLNKNHQVIAQCLDLRLTQLNDVLQIEKISAIQSQFHLDCSLPYQDCKTQLLNFLTEQFSNLFSMPHQDINIHQSLREFGMDSLMAMAVIRTLETSLSVNYSLPLLIKGPSILELAEQILVDKCIIKKQASPELITTNKNLWVSNRKNLPDARVRLFCFPYGGAGASIYREWQRSSPEWIELCPIQLPGRENRMDEKPLNDMNTLIQLLAKNLTPMFDMPFAFFGHSFGSLVAFELTRYLRKHDLPQPLHLFVAAYPNPSQPSKSLNSLLMQLQKMDINLFDIDQNSIHQLNDEKLTTLSRIFKENGLVDYSDERLNKSIIQILLPIFIGDMNIVKNYVFHHEPALNLNATVFLGEQDTWVKPEEHLGWPEHFTQHCEFQLVNSSHLFIKEESIRKKIINKITGILCKYTEIEIETK